MSKLEEKAKRFKDPESSIENPIDYRKKSFILIDGMALVQSMNKAHEIKFCRDFAQAFLKKVENDYSAYNNIYIVFDVYKENSLKNQMREKRSRRKNTYYRVTDNTLMKNVSLKDFVSSIKTKNELTKYLGQKIMEHNFNSNKNIENVVVPYGNKRYSKSSDIPLKF